MFKKPIETTACRNQNIILKLVARHWRRHNLSRVLPWPARSSLCNTWSASLTSCTGGSSATKPAFKLQPQRASVPGRWACCARSSAPPAVLVILLLPPPFKKRSYDIAGGSPVICDTISFTNILTLQTTLYLSLIGTGNGLYLKSHISILSTYKLWQNSTFN